ncbi:MAG: Uma2 family endonuclease [Verrucomicrobiae bacterium]|nr:Uma2 family endonuclease [Verrucomicrobiae bacterium]
MPTMLDQPEIRERIHPISVATYHALGETGLVDEKVELLRGYLVDKMSKSPLHSFICQRLVDWLRIATESSGQLVRQEQPLTFRDSEPEPDIAVVSGSREDFARSHPTIADLVIEVAVNSVNADRAKAPIYAEAGIPMFLLIKPAEDAIEVFTAPENGEYRGHRVARAGDTIECPSVWSFSIVVDALFGA